MGKCERGETVRKVRNRNARRREELGNGREDGMAVGTHQAGSGRRRNTPGAHGSDLCIAVEHSKEVEGHVTCVASGDRDFSLSQP